MQIVVILLFGVMLQVLAQQRGISGRHSRGRSIGADIHRIVVVLLLVGGIELTDVCTNCGALRMQHDAAGRCPRYD